MSATNTIPKPQLKLCTTPFPNNTYSRLLMAAPHSSASSIHSVSSPHSHPSTRSLPMPKYADEHYPLISTIHPERIPAHIPSTHSAIHCSRMMAQIHNTVIRAINSSYNHCLSIEPGTQEAGHFLFYNRQIATTLDHHHHIEDDYLFPEIERQLGRPGLMQENTVGPEKFTEALQVFDKYVHKTKASEYNGLTFRHLIEAFAPDLIQRLHDEIPMLTELYVLDSKRLAKAWKVAERMVAKDAELFVAGPFVLGCQDKCFKVDGKQGEFPAVPWVIEKVVEKWTSRRHAGAWRYLPCTVSGERRLLPLQN